MAVVVDGAAVVETAGQGERELEPACLVDALQDSAAARSDTELAGLKHRADWEDNSRQRAARRSRDRQEPVPVHVACGFELQDTSFRSHEIVRRDCYDCCCGCLADAAQPVKEHSHLRCF